MAQKKRQLGRPSQKVNLQSKEVSTEANIVTEKEVENHGTSQEHQQTQKDETAKTNKVVEVKEKVIEVKTKKAPHTEVLPSQRRNNSFDVIVKGRLRAMSRQAYEAVSKDPKLRVTLPENSPLAVKLDAKGKPCKDC